MYVYLMAVAIQIIQVNYCRICSNFNYSILSDFLVQSSNHLSSNRQRAIQEVDNFYKKDLGQNVVGVGEIKAGNFGIAGTEGPSSFLYSSLVIFRNLKENCDIFNHLLLARRGNGTFTRISRRARTIITLRSTSSITFSWQPSNSLNAKWHQS